MLYLSGASEGPRLTVHKRNPYSFDFVQYFAEGASSNEEHDVLQSRDTKIAGAMMIEADPAARKCRPWGLITAWWNFWMRLRFHRI